jgi:hypothetical protein
MRPASARSQIGMRSATRPIDCSSSSATGSERSEDGSHRPCDDLGASWRAARPVATRSSTVRRARLQADANGTFPWAHPGVLGRREALTSSHPDSRGFAPAARSLLGSRARSIDHSFAERTLPVRARRDHTSHTRADVVLGPILGMDLLSWQVTRCGTGLALTL